MHKFYLTQENGICACVWVYCNAEEVIKQAAKSLVENVKLISGFEPLVKQYTDFSEITDNAVVLCSPSNTPQIKELISKLSSLKGTDGFVSKKTEGKIYLCALKPEGVYYAAHSLLERNAQIIWTRAKEEFRFSYHSQKTIELKDCNFLERPHFKYRGWNLCGVGVEGDHLDTPTVEFLGRNKNNIKMLEYIEGWQKYGLNPHGYVVHELNDLEDLYESHPEYFMTDVDGTSPKPAQHEAFFNYYNMDAAKELARRIKAYIASGRMPYNSLRVMMPDNPYFTMVQGGAKLHEQPFTTKEGVTVYPYEECYKSTVYFNFLNEVTKSVCEEYPNFVICTFAYMYSEIAPKLTLHNNLCVWYAPINASDHIAYTDDASEYAKSVRDNIENWSKVTSNLAMYNYWLSAMQGCIYSRPIAKVVQKNLKYYRSLNITGLVPEGMNDLATAKGNDDFYNMNELYIWLMNRLLWNPDEDLDALTEKFCRLTYSAAAPYMLKYYALIQKGWDESDAIVKYFTGGDVYIQQFIIKAGIADEVLQNLKNALAAADTKASKARISPILSILEKQIAIFSKAVNEDCLAVYTDAGIDTVLSDEHLDYKNNAKSVWNKAVPLKVLKDYNNMDDYDPKANFEARMLWDKEYIYIGYSVHDDMLSDKKPKKNTAGSLLVERTDGSVIESYIEMYIAGNSLNTSSYHGYFTGFFRQRGVQYYLNHGGPTQKNLPKGFKWRDYVHYSKMSENCYYFHVMAIAFKDLDINWKDATPCGSFVYYNDRYKRAGWKGNGLWCRQAFSLFELVGKEKLINEENRCLF